MGKKIDLDIQSPYTDNIAGQPTSSPAGGSFGNLTFGEGSDATRTPVSVEEVQFADIGVDLPSGGVMGMD